MPSMFKQLQIFQMHSKIIIKLTKIDSTHTLKTGLHFSSTKNNANNNNNLNMFR